MGVSERHEKARGGERVLIRPARPADAALYAEFLAGVTAEDLRLRFYADIAELSAKEQETLSRLEHPHDVALVALDEDTGRMLGLARLKEELDEQTAEFAILVGSRLKGHGVGWLLMRRVIEHAREKGLRRVYGDVLAENTAMLQMAGELGFRAHDMWAGVKRVVLDLPSRTS